MPTETPHVLLLVDGSSFVFRAFHAIRHLSTRSGFPTNAVFGVTKMLLKLLGDLLPSHVAVVLDKGGKTFRHDLYPEYKAHRPPVPEDLKVQFPAVRDAIQAFRLPLLEQAGVEADDLIGSLTRAARSSGFHVVIATGDKDLMQLVDEGVSIVDSMRELTYDREAVKAKLGVYPEQVADWLALCGDASDNVPGVSGVGEKTAAKLLIEHGSLEKVLSAARIMKPSKLRDHLLAEVDQARLSQRLTRLKTDCPIPLTWDELIRQEPDEAQLGAFFDRYEFADLRGRGSVRPVSSGPPPVVQALPRITTIISDSERFAQLLARIRETQLCAIDLETTDLDPLRAEVVGVSLCPALGEACYIPLAHCGPDTRSFDAPRQLDRDQVLSALQPLLADSAIGWVGQNLKYDLAVLRHRTGGGIARVACDTLLASYLLDPDRPSHSLDALARDQLKHEPLTYAQVTQNGTIPFAEVDIATATAYSGEDADLAYRLSQIFLPRLREAELERVFFELELPLLPVLVELERNGVRLDPVPLQALGSELGQLLGQAEERIHRLAGRPFNVNSPVQLRQILFGELKLPIKKKTKSGPSTDSSVLEELAVEHDLPAEILAYRSLAKLKSTYVDVLPRMIRPDTGRVHTSFHQNVTATGRLSSSDPNLQNIPVRSELGRRIRQAFVASPGCRLFSADYSQVELRILAHLCQDEALLSAFACGEDIHARTAARVFGVPIEKVTGDMRRRAKAVNFGIIYGQGPFALARQLRIPQAEARDIIAGYLDRHARVRGFVEETHAAARRQGFVSTLFGRKRWLPDIHSPNHNARANAERMAQNTVVQGSAADIIKRAMIDVHHELARRAPGSRMILQVHDELVFEAPEGELVVLEDLVREKMEQAARLSVPLVVDVAVGANWAEAH